MVERWNAVVKPHDHVYHLGDVAMAESSLYRVRQLNGHKRLILGNHDKFKIKLYSDVGFDKILGARVFDGILFTHYPVHGDSGGANGEGKIKGNAHGHTHERVSPPGPYVNLCVEQTNYAPIALDEVKAWMRTRWAKHEMV